MTLSLKPFSLAAARDYILAYHRHHKPPVGHKFSIGAVVGSETVGVAVVGRPVARMLDDGYTAEVTRLCTNGTKNACSILYAACARSARGMGYRKIITYILESENGASLRASGWTFECEAGGGSWSRPSRGREDKHPLEKKHRYAKMLAEAPRAAPSLEDMLA